MDSSTEENDRVHAILVRLSRLNLEEHGTKVETVGVKSSQHSWEGQYKKFVLYDFKFT